MIQDLLRDVVVVKVRIVMQRGFQTIGLLEMMGLQYFGNPAIEAFDHAIGLRVAWRYQVMLNALLDTGAIEPMVPGGPLFTAQAAIREFRTVVGQTFMNPEPRGLNKGFQKGFGGLCGAVFLQGTSNYRVLSQDDRSQTPSRPFSGQTSHR